MMLAIAPEGAPTNVVFSCRTVGAALAAILSWVQIKTPSPKALSPWRGRGEYGVVLIYLRKIWGGVTERIAAEAAPTGGAENAVCRSDFNRDVAGLDNRSYYGTI